MTKWKILALATVFILMLLGFNASRRSDLTENCRSTGDANMHNAAERCWSVPIWPVRVHIHKQAFGLSLTAPANEGYVDLDGNTVKRYNVLLVPWFGIVSFIVFAVAWWMFGHNLAAKLLKRGKASAPVATIATPATARWVKLVGITVAACLVVAGYMVWGNRQGNGGGSRNAATTQVDPDPCGTWVEGDQSSVFNRLIIQSSGRFAFQTVDFTGDVKGGYSGTWKLEGKSVRFEWGSGAGSGSCSGRRTGVDTLVFGSTTFSK